MSLVAHTITALQRDVADASGTGKQVIIGATCSMFLQPADSAVVLYDNAAGANGNTAKLTGSNGQVVVYVEPGQYRLSVNGINSYVTVSVDGAALAVSDSTVVVGGVEAGAFGRKYNSTPDIKDFGAVGDGTTSDQSAFDLAIATSQANVNLPDKGSYLVPDDTNPLGKVFAGNGHIVKAVTGGLEAQNTYADLYQRVTGQENLAAWYKLIWLQFLSPTRALKIVFSGDSTTAGGVGNGVNNGYNMHEIVPEGIANRGLQGAYGITAVNRGQSGAHTGQWAASFVAGDVAEAADLYIVRWGINDPGWLKSGLAAPLNAGQDYPNRRDVGDFATSLRSGLTTMRASLPFETTSILLMMPNGTYDIPNARDALWYEQLRDVYVQAARDFNCAFIDTYAIMQDSKLLSNMLMDNPFGDGRGIHPNDAMNSIIAGHICDLIAPEGFKYKFSKLTTKSQGGAEYLPAASVSPAAYSNLHYTRAALASGYPIEGGCVTFVTSDNIALQFNFGYAVADQKKLAVRTGRAAELGGEGVGWNSFATISLSTGKEPLAPAAGFITPSTGNLCRLQRSGDQVILDGAVEMSTPATLTLNQVLANYSGTNAPVGGAAHGIATLYDGSVGTELIPVYIGTDGILRAFKASTIAPVFVNISIGYNI